MTEPRSASSRPSVAALRSLWQQPLVRRIVASTGSNAYAQATTIAMQLLSLPVFLAHWDLVTYGQWLVLSTVPAYLAMADGGMLAAAGNRMTMLMGDGRPREAQESFQSALAVVLGVSLCALPLMFLAVLLWPGSMSAESIQARGAVMALSAGVVAALLGGLSEAVYKATHRYALGAALANTTRLIEWAGSLVGLWWGGDFISVAVGGLLARVACTVGISWHAAHTTPELRWGFADASRAEIRQCARPALSFMAFPAANALNFQGMTLVAAAMLGPAAAVVFNTYRTIARVTVQATAVFSLALWPEFSRLYGQRKLSDLAALFRRSRALGLMLSGGASVAVYLAAPTILAFWSRERIDFDPGLMAVSMVYAAVAGIWYVSRVLLLSTNRHGGLAWPNLVASVAAVGLAWALVHLAPGDMGLVAIMLAMLTLEIAMLALCSHLARRLLAGEPSAEERVVAA